MMLLRSINFLVLMFFSFKALPQNSTGLPPLTQLLTISPPGPQEELSPQQREYLEDVAVVIKQLVQRDRICYPTASVENELSQFTQRFAIYMLLWLNKKDDVDGAACSMQKDALNEYKKCLFADENFKKSYDEVLAQKEYLEHYFRTKFNYTKEEAKTMLGFLEYLREIE